MIDLEHHDPADTQDTFRNAASPEAETAFLNGLGLTREEREALYDKNAEALTGVSLRQKQ